MFWISATAPPAQRRQVYCAVSGAIARACDMTRSSCAVMHPTSSATAPWIVLFPLHGLQVAAGEASGNLVQQHHFLTEREAAKRTVGWFLSGTAGWLLVTFIGR